MDKTTVDTHVLDMVNGQGTPLRIRYLPDTDKVRVYDRRYSLSEGQPGYGPHHATEEGQVCGPDMYASDFTDGRGSGIRGWHEVDAWDLDRETVALVGEWITMLKERGVSA